MITNLLNNILTDETKTNISSKRVITMLAFVLFAIGFIAELFWNYSVKPAMLEAVMFIIIAGLGFTASEKFASKTGKEK
jgi:hypothetical protein